MDSLSADRAASSGHASRSPGAAQVLLILLVAAVALAVFVPYVAYGGFIYDGMDICYRVEQWPGLWSTYTAWFPKFAYRPLAPVLFSIESNAFGRWEPGYIVVTLAFWATAVWLIAAVVGQYFGSRFATVFALLALFPSMSSTVLFDPSMQVIGTSAVLLWSISFFLIDRSTRSARPVRWIVAANLFVLAAFLIYEIAFPLLVISVLWAWAISEDGASLWRRCTSRGYLAKYVLPPFGILVGVTLYQKIILPQFVVSLSRMRLNPANSVASVMSWGLAVLVQFPAMLMESLLHLHTAFEFVWTPLLVAVLLAIIAWRLKAQQDAVPSPGAVEATADLSRARRRIVMVVCLALLACSLLYFLTNIGAVVWGLANRGLTSTWIALALLLGMAAEMRRRSFVWQAAVAVVVVLNLLSFVEQRNNYIRGWALQQETLAELARATEAADVPHGSFVLGNVPVYLTDNYNDEFVFRSELDFGLEALRHSKGKFRAGTVLAPETLEFGILGDVTDEHVEVAVDTPLEATYDELWYFEYDQATKQSRLFPIRDAAHMNAIIEHVQTSSVNEYRQPWLKPFFASLRDRIKAIVRGQKAVGEQPPQE